MYLQQGGVVAFPTDTFYGLAADTLCVSGIARVFRIKGRWERMALPVLLSDARELSGVAIDIPDVAWRLAERFWPGALTLVLKRASAVPEIVSGGKDTVGVRVPDDPVARELIRRLGRPLTGTSANPTGTPAARTADEVRALLGAKVDFVIDGGARPGGQPSTVLDLTGAVPSILRSGKIAIEELSPYLKPRLETGVTAG